MERIPHEFSAPEGCARSKPVNTDIEMSDFGPGAAANDGRMSKLARTIEQEIIPRLMLAHRIALEPFTRDVVADLQIAPEDVHAFAKQVLSHEEDAASVTIEQLRTRGVSIDKVFVDLLAPTARLLGHLWDEDLCSFTDVTVGLGRLQRVLRELCSEMGRSVDHAAQGRRVLLVPAPGEQHTFGLVMVAELFRRAGWDVTGGAWISQADVPALVASEWFDVVGFSLGSQLHLAALTEAIASVRHAACNQAIAVLVGGPLFGLHPEYMDGLGADGVSVDGREAPGLAQRLIDGRIRQRGMLA